MNEGLLMLGKISAGVAEIAILFLIIEYVKRGMAGENVYTKWTIGNVILGVFLWRLGIVSVIAEIITYLIAKDHKAKEEKWNEQYTNTTYEPGPGSDAHYEQWKAEREERED